MLKEKEAPTILFCHENAGNIGLRLPELKKMHSELKVSVVAWCMFVCCMSACCLLQLLHACLLVAACFAACCRPTCSRSTTAGMASRRGHRPSQVRRECSTQAYSTRYDLPWCARADRSASLALRSGARLSVCRESIAARRGGLAHSAARARGLCAACLGLRSDARKM